MPMIATLIIAGSQFLFPETTSLRGALLALVAASWTTTGWALPLTLVLVRKRLTDTVSETPRGTAFIRLHAHRLAPMMGTSLLAYGTVWAPVFILSATSALSEVSYYSIAARLASMIAIIPTIQISYLAPEFARRFYTGDLRGLNSLAGRSTLFVAAATIVPLLILLSLSYQVVHFLFGDSFLAATPIVIILCCASFVVLLFGQVNQLMLLCELEKTALLLTLSAMAAWTTIGIWAGAHSGAVGIAWIAAGINVAYAGSGAFALRQLRGIRSYVGRIGTA